jgi:hypothetical protein
MAAYDENLEPIPEPIENIRRPKSIYNNPNRFYQRDIGRLHDVRESLMTRANNSNVQPENIQEVLAFSGRGRTREKKLPEKVGMNDLYRVVQDLKRDIKFVREAQSEAGAKQWIAQHGYGDKLYVDQKDIDDDGIPDIIVKKRSDRSPYIVKGYTTVDSGYPLRNAYYTNVPKEERKTTTFRDYLEDISVDYYNRGGLSATLKPAFTENVDRMRSAGYKIRPPSEKITAYSAFKRFIMKPLMKAVKEIVKDRNYPFHLTAQKARDVESFLRHNLITEPVLLKVYGPDILQINDEKQMKKLIRQSKVQEGIKDLTAHLIDNRILMQDELVDGLVKILFDQNVIDGRTADELSETLKLDVLNDYKPWTNPRLERGKSL